MGLGARRVVTGGVYMASMIEDQKPGGRGTDVNGVVEGKGDGGKW